ncbi:jouberin [Amia ocellicauda]|uniref:jouberin n=1 Tax=Amia ocellicauda TaxID=2972642 RepID=UPI0034640A95
MPSGESEAKAKTRARFEEVFKSYTDLPTDKKKSKKKSTHIDDSIVFESLKKNLDLHKEAEDAETILNNTYNREQGSPRYTKNKQRERGAVVEKVNNNDLTEGESKPAKTKKKKKKSTEDQVQVEGLQRFITTEGQHQQNAMTEQFETGIQADATEKKPKRRKPKSTQDSNNDLEDEDEILIKDYARQMAEEEEKAMKTKLRKKNAEKMSAAAAMMDFDQDVTLNNQVEKKKKKTLKSNEAEQETSLMSLSELQTSQQDGGGRKKKKKQKIVTSDEEREGLEEEADGTVEKEERDVQTKTKGKKKKKAKDAEENKGGSDDVSTADSEAHQSLQRRAFDDSLVLGVYVHRTDRLKTDLLVSHPMVKVHVIDEMTEQYVRKENSNRPVSSFYEQEKVDHILPIMTQPYDFKKNKSTVPEWEEQIVFNERFGYFLQETEESPKVMLFFEVLDIMSMYEARANVEADRHERGFRKISWAFLKLVGTNGVLNVNGKLRLQLYCPPPRVRKQSHTVEVFNWWKKFPRQRYSSTLYVTIKGLKLPDYVDPCVRSMMALQQERGSTSYSELQSEVTRKGAHQLLEQKRTDILKWSRLPGQVCRIPNKPMFCFRGGQMGCFGLRFSHDGRMLATSCADRDGYPIIVYEISSGKVLGAFNGHLCIVYDLCWSRDDKNLLSASSDGTVRIWNVETLQGLAEKVLPHPAFIYTARYHPSAQYLVVTGGYDCVIRVWDVNVKDINGQLLQEFEGHKSFINTLCFDVEGLRMFSGDSSGLIIMWNVVAGSDQHPTQQWCIEKEIEGDLKGIPVNHLEIHPNGRRLLIHAKDSLVRVMDLRMLATKKYTGATNYREKIHSTFTPCGSFIFSGSEDGMCYVWNAETGDQVAVYSELCYPTALRDVAFHPHEHMVAFCAFGQNQPVHVYHYDRKVAQMEAESMQGPTLFRSKEMKTICGTTDAAGLQDSTISSVDCFASAARLSLKLQRVQQKLDSVLEPMHQNSSAMDYLYEHQGGATYTARNLTQETGVISPISSTYINTVVSNLSLPAPSLLSPHSKLRLPGSLGTQLTSQPSLTSHSRGFSPVGQRFSRAPSLKLQTSFGDPSASVLTVQADSFVPVQHTVVSLYDYTANRSDELTIHRGDIIQVLYKDNENWWFGCLANGQQGYFPANYVADERGFEEELSHTESNDQTNETAEQSPTPAKMSAVISASGDLKFISDHDTDTDSPVPVVQKKKKKKKSIESKSQAASDTAAASDPVLLTLPARKKRANIPGKPVAKRGQTNNAFEPDY